MAKNFYKVVTALLLCSCSIETEKSIDDSPASLFVDDETSVDEIELHKLKKLFVLGDFDGDKKQDTLFQRAYSNLSQAEIEYSADPFQNDWETVIDWLYKNEVNVSLTLNEKNSDTLKIGVAQGLYCLINLGDMNADGKEEIALVVDHLDVSSMNKCKIYTYCNNKWIMLKEFSIHEVAFTYSTSNAPLFAEIKGYLEKRNGRWMYREHSDVVIYGENDVKMNSLKLDRCD